MLTTENLRGLPPVFTDLELTQVQGNRAAFVVDSGPLFEVLTRIKGRTSYGEAATGKYLTDEFLKEPFGWEFDAVRLFVASLLRAGLVEATSQGQAIDSALTPEAERMFTNNNLFRGSSFRPKQTGLSFAELAQVSTHYQTVFGKEVPEISLGVLANAIRDSIATVEAEIKPEHDRMLTHRLPGSQLLAECLNEISGIRSGGDEKAVVAFNSSYSKIKEGIRRGHDLKQALTEPRLHDWERAGRALRQNWPFLAQEPDLPQSIRDAHARLVDLMQRETFFQDFPAIDQTTRELEQTFTARHQEASQQRQAAYISALEILRAHTAWPALTPDQQKDIGAPLESLAQIASLTEPIPQIRSETEACESRLNRAIESMMRIVDGNRLVKIQLGAGFKSGIETVEQLDSALEGLREEIVLQINQGKKVLIQ